MRIARQVSHPNVCRVYDIGEIEGMPFISMEYVDGEDLASLLTRIGRLPADKALETARKLCAGLAAAHDRGVIHRDLKPQNIMMNKRGEVVIMDFGLAAIANELDRRGGAQRHARLHVAGATEGRGSHRQERYLRAGPGALRAVHRQAALRCEDRAAACWTCRKSAQLTSMTSVAADIDPAVEKVIRRCLDPDPAKRPVEPLCRSSPRCRAAIRWRPLWPRAKRLRPKWWLPQARSKAWICVTRCRASR